MTSKKRIQTVLVDDEYIGRAFLRNLLEEFCPEVEIIGEADSLADAQICIEKHKPQLVFLDIYLPDGDGFRLLERFPNRNFEVIFTTAHDQHSLEAFEVQALQYLLKPIDPEALSRAVKQFSPLFLGEQGEEELQQDPEQQSPKRLAIVSKEEIVFVWPEELIRCEADGNYTHLYLKGGQHLLSSKTLSYFEKLLKDEPFFRVHDKHLINLNQVEKFLRGQGGQVQLCESHLVAVSMRRRDALLELLMK